MSADADRGRRGAGWTLITPANHDPSRLPELPGAIVVKLVTSRLAPSRIAESLVELPAGAESAGPVGNGFESCLYVLDGALELAQATVLRAGGFAYLPAREAVELRAGPEGAAHFLWLKRRYEPWGDLAGPGPVIAHRDDEPFAATPVPGFTRRELVPVDDPRFDLAVSLLRFEPGVGLPNVEIHDEEHGLFVTAGGGTYLLDGETLPVSDGDFVYMAPYCPQGFVAGPDGAEYLLYKDAYRDGF